MRYFNDSALLLPRRQKNNFVLGITVNEKDFATQACKRSLQPATERQTLRTQSDS